MNNSAGKEWYGIGLDTSQFDNAAKRVIGQFDSIENNAVRSGSNIERSFLKAGAALLTMAGAKQVVSQIANVRGEFQQLEIAFTTMLGSAEKADALMRQLVNTAAKTPFDLTGVATGAKQLMAYGFELDKVNDTLVMLGDIASGVSVPLNDIVYLYGTLRASGRVMTMDIRQFAGRGIPIYEELAKVLKVNTDQINEMASAGRISAKDIEKAFQNMTSEGGRFNNLMEKQAASIVGLKSNFGDAIDTATNDLGKKLEPAMESVLRGGIDLVENYKEIGKTIIELVAIYGVYKASLIAIMAIHRLNMKIIRQAVLEKKLAAMASIQLSNAEAIAAARTKILTIAQAGLIKSIKATTAAMLANPYVWVAIAIAGIAFAIYKLVTAESAEEKALKRLNNEMEKTSERRDEITSKSNDLISAINDETKSVYQQIKAWKELKSLFPNLFKDMDIDQFKSMSANEIKSLINQSIDSDEIKQATEQFKNAQQEILRLNNSIDTIIKNNSDESGILLLSYSKKLEEAQEYLKLSKNHLTELLDIQKQATFESKPENEKLEFYKNELESLKKQREEIDKKLISLDSEKNFWERDEVAMTLYENKLDDLNKKIGITSEKIEKLSKSESESKNKSYWEKKKEEAEAARDALDISKKNSDEWNKLESEISKAQAQIDKYSNTKEKKQNNSKQEIDDRLKSIEDAKNQIREREIDSEFEIWQGKIDAMKDGYDKQKAQIELNYQKTLTENRRLGDQMIKDHQDIERQIWESQNPDWKEKNKTFTPFMAKLPEDQQKELNEKDKNAYDLKLQAEQKLITDLLEKYADYAAQRISIEKQFNDDIAHLESLRTNENSSSVDRAIEQAKKMMNESLSDVSFNEFKDSGLWDKMFGDLDKVATKTLKKILVQAKQVNTSAWSPENVKEYQEAIERLEKKIAENSPFEELRKDWKNLIEAIKSDDSDEIKNSLQGISDFVSKTNEDLKTIGSGIGDIFGEDAGYAADTIIEITSSIADLGQAAAKFASGDIVGGIAAVISGVSRFFKISKAVKEMNEQARKEQQEFYDQALQGEYEYQLLIRERLRLEKQIGETALSYQKRITEEILKQKNQNISTFDSMLKELQQMQYVFAVGYQRGTWFRKARTWNVYESLSGKTYDEIEQLYMQGRLEEKAVALFEQLQELKNEGVDIDQMLTDSANEFREALSGISFDSLRDSFRSFMEDGKIEISETADFMEQVFRDAILNSLLIKTFDSKLQDLTTRIQDAVEAGTFEDQYEAFKIEAEALGKQINDSLNPFRELGIFDQKRQASSKGITSMSQDSGDELNGRATAIQGHTFQMNENIKLLAKNSDIILKHLAGINSDTTGIKENTKRLEKIESDMSSMKSDISDINLKGIKIKTA